MNRTLQGIIVSALAAGCVVCGILLLRKSTDAPAANARASAVVVSGAPASSKQARPRTTEVSPPVIASPATDRKQKSDKLKNETFAMRVARPEFKSLMLQSLELQVERQYSALLRSLHLEPAKLTQARELLAERFLLGPSSDLWDESEKMRAQEIDRRLTEVLGPAGTLRYESYMENGQAVERILNDFQNIVSVRAKDVDDYTLEKVMMQAIESKVAIMPAHEAVRTSLPEIRSMLEPEQFDVLVAVLDKQAAEESLNSARKKANSEIPTPTVPVQFGIH